MNKTGIGWTDFTSNPLRARNLTTRAVGHFCTKVSPGCTNCYASTWNSERYGTGIEFLPANLGRVEFYLEEEELKKITRSTKKGLCFICDMTDMFHEAACPDSTHPDDWRATIFGAMAVASNLTFQVLTKRPGAMHRFLSDPLTSNWVRNKAIERWRQMRLGFDEIARLSGQWTWPLPNVWLGVSVENQYWAEARIPVLLKTPAALRFISAEPLLRPLDLTFWAHRSYDWASSGGPNECQHGYEPGLGCPICEPSLDWVIVGAESGAKRRTFETEWVEGIVSQCRAAGVAVFVKQGSAFKPGQQGSIPDALWSVKEFPR